MHIRIIYINACFMCMIYICMRERERERKSRFWRERGVRPRWLNVCVCVMTHSKAFCLLNEAKTQAPVSET